VPVGVPPDQCGDGFESDARGGCSAVLPEEACPPGQMALPGDLACAPVGDCVPGRWAFVTGGDVIHVDGSYAGGDADGSADKPWPTIAEGVAAAVSGQTVAIADGTYEEDVLIEASLTLVGRCPEAVTIRGMGGQPAALVILTQASVGTVVRGLSLTGPGVAVGMAATDATFEQVWIHDTGGHGVDVIAQQSPTSATMHRVLIERAVELGVFVTGAQAVLDGVVIRETRPTAADALGLGLFARAGDGALALPMSAAVDIQGSVVRDNRAAALSLAGADLTARRTIVRDTQPQLADGEDGFGLLGIVQADGGFPSTAALDQVVVERAFAGGVVMQAGQLDASRLTVRDVQPNQATGAFGSGVSFQLGSDGAAAGTLVDSSVQRAHGEGVFVAGSDAVVERTIVRETLPYDASAALGDGLLVSAYDQAASLTVRGCRVEDNARAGVASFGADVAVGETMMICNAIDLNGQDIGGTFSFVDQGGNLCRCDDADRPCQLQGAALLPPEAP